jgi:hypothetical protein
MKMGKQNKLAWLAFLSVAACDPAADPTVNINGDGAAADVAVGTANLAAAAEGTKKDAERPARPVAYTLTSDGIAPGLKLGMAEAEALSLAAKAFGTATLRDHNDECIEGPMDFVHFQDLQLSFKEGKLAGWSLSGKAPALRTAGGITFGTPRSALGEMTISEPSSLGPEFEIGDIGGVLGEDGKVANLWLGETCQFR